jgi:hypothetical protein
METLPGTIALGKFRIIYEQERQRSSTAAGDYLLQQRAIIRLDEDLVRLADQEDCFSLDSLARAAQGIRYIFKIKTEAPLETVIKLMQAADKGCHTVNSMRKRMMVAGKFVLNDFEYQIHD